MIVAAALAGCGPEPLCGVDELGEDVPVCAYDGGLPEARQFCPGEHWAAVDGCNSCACDNDGTVLCTSVECGTE